MTRNTFGHLQGNLFRVQLTKHERYIGKDDGDDDHRYRFTTCDVSQQRFDITDKIG